jgi:hypothetical protein
MFFWDLINWVPRFRTEHCDVVGRQGVGRGVFENTLYLTRDLMEDSAVHEINSINSIKSVRLQSA